MSALIDLTKKTFGLWVVIERGSNSQCGEPRWLCECKCGVTKLVYGGNLRTQKSTGCLQCRPSSNWKGYEEISGRYWSNLTTRAGSRGLIFEITIQEAWQQFAKQNRRCALTGQVLTFAKHHSQTSRDQSASLDRIDSHQGYTQDNIQWVHKDINLLKRKLDESEFIALCKQVARHK